MHIRYWFIIIVLFLFGCGQGEKSSVAQENLAKGITHKVVQHPPIWETYSFAGAKNAETVKQIRSHIQLGLTVTFSWDRRYRKSLEGLRKQAAEVVSLLSEEYERQKEQAYQARFYLILTAVELNDATAIPFFEKTLAARIPAEKSKDLHHFSTVSEEAQLRMAAIHGLVRLAKEGDQSAKALLQKTAVNPTVNRAVKVEAILGYLDAAKDEQQAKGELKQTLLSKDWPLLELARLSPADKAKLQEIFAPLQNKAGKK